MPKILEREVDPAEADELGAFSEDALLLVDAREAMVPHEVAAIRPGDVVAVLH